MRVMLLQPMDTVSFSDGQAMDFNRPLRPEFTGSTCELARSWHLKSAIGSDLPCLTPECTIALLQPILILGNAQHMAVLGVPWGSTGHVCVLADTFRDALELKLGLLANHLEWAKDIMPCKRTCK